MSEIGLLQTVDVAQNRASGFPDESKRRRAIIHAGSNLLAAWQCRRRCVDHSKGEYLWQI